ncbi:MAG: helix-turn-helix transcriptional regulator [Oscillospiraceae bacterium]|nr:helix-turn-helix transcriptional regulator [Oscillospiraceae bacterium]
MTIHEAIRLRRQEAELSQNQLGKLSGVPTRNICYWESGHGDPPISACIKLAQAMSITVGELVAGCEDEQKDA